MKQKRGLPKPHRKLPIFSAVILILALLLAFFLAYEFGLVRKNCKQDATCFEEMAKECKPSTHLTLKNLNYYRYVIYGVKRGECEVKIELKRMAVGTPSDRIEMLEGKEMECLLPYGRWKDLAEGDIEGLLKHCTGGLKEGMYELIIKKLYSVVIVNMGDVIGSIEDTLKKERI